MWPDGIWRTDYLERDAGTQIRTRIAAKAKMLGTVPGRPFSICCQQLISEFWNVR